MSTPPPITASKKPNNSILHLFKNTVNKRWTFMTGACCVVTQHQWREDPVNWCECPARRFHNTVDLRFCKVTYLNEEDGLTWVLLVEWQYQWEDITSHTFTLRASQNWVYPSRLCKLLCVRTSRSEAGGVVWWGGSTVTGDSWNPNKLTSSTHNAQM